MKKPESPAIKKELLDVVEKYLKNNVNNVKFTPNTPEQDEATHVNFIVADVAYSLDLYDLADIGKCVSVSKKYGDAHNWNIAEIHYQERDKVVGKLVITNRDGTRTKLIIDPYDPKRNYKGLEITCMDEKTKEKLIVNLAKNPPAIKPIPPTPKNTTPTKVASTGIKPATTSTQTTVKPIAIKPVTPTTKTTEPSKAPVKTTITAANPVTPTTKSSTSTTKTTEASKAPVKPTTTAAKPVTPTTKTSTSSTTKTTEPSKAPAKTTTATKSVTPPAKTTNPTQTPAQTKATEDSYINWMYSTATDYVAQKAQETKTAATNYVTQKAQEATTNASNYATKKTQEFKTAATNAAITAAQTAATTTKAAVTYAATAAAGAATNAATAAAGAATNAATATAKVAYEKLMADPETQYYLSKLQALISEITKNGNPIDDFTNVTSLLSLPQVQGLGAMLSPDKNQNEEQVRKNLTSFLELLKEINRRKPSIQHLSNTCQSFSECYTPTISLLQKVNPVFRVVLLYYLTNMDPTTAVPSALVEFLLPKMREVAVANNSQAGVYTVDMLNKAIPAVQFAMFAPKLAAMMVAGAVTTAATTAATIAYIGLDQTKQLITVFNEIQALLSDNEINALHNDNVGTAKNQTKAAAAKQAATSDPLYTAWCEFYKDLPKSDNPVKNMVYNHNLGGIASLTFEIDNITYTLTENSLEKKFSQGTIIRESTINNKTVGHLIIKNSNNQEHSYNIFQYDRNQNYDKVNQLQIIIDDQKHSITKKGNAWQPPPALPKKPTAPTSVTPSIVENTKQAAEQFTKQAATDFARAYELFKGITKELPKLQTNLQSNKQEYKEFIANLNNNYGAINTEPSVENILNILNTIKYILQFRKKGAAASDQIISLGKNCKELYDIYMKYNQYRSLYSYSPAALATKATINVVSNNWQPIIKNLAANSGGEILNIIASYSNLKGLMDEINEQVAQITNSGSTPTPMLEKKSETNNATGGVKGKR